MLTGCIEAFPSIYTFLGPLATWQSIYAGLWRVQTGKA